MCCKTEEEDEKYPLVFYSDEECMCCSEWSAEYDSDDPWKDLYELGLSSQKSTNECSTTYVPLVQHCDLVTAQQLCCSGSYCNNEEFDTLSPMDHIATGEEDTDICTCAKRAFYNFPDASAIFEDSYNNTYYTRSCSHTPSAIPPAAFSDPPVLPYSKYSPKGYKKDKRKRDTLYFCGKAIKIPLSSQKYLTCTSTLGNAALDLEVIAKPMMQQKNFTPQDKTKAKRNKLKVAFGRIIEQQKENPIAKRQQTF